MPECCICQASRNGNCWIELRVYHQASDHPHLTMPIASFVCDACMKNGFDVAMIVGRGDEGSGVARAWTRSKGETSFAYRGSKAIDKLPAPRAGAE